MSERPQQQHDGGTHRGAHRARAVAVERVVQASLERLRHRIADKGLCVEHPTPAVPPGTV